MDSMIIMAGAAIGTYVILAGYAAKPVKPHSPSLWSRLMGWFRGKNLEEEK